MDLIPRDIIVYHIFKFLDLTSRIRASAVSRHWKDIYKAAPPLPNIPWIFFTSPTFVSNSHSFTSETNFYLLDPSSSTTIHNRCYHALSNVVSGTGSPSVILSIADVPESTEEISAKKIGRQLFGFSIYNPYAGDMIEFPCPRYGKYTIDTFSFSSHPQNGLVVAWVVGLDFTQLHVYKPDLHELVVGPRYSFSVRDMRFYRAEFYCISEFDITAIDIKHNTDRHASAQPRPGRVIASCGLLWDDIDFMDSRVHYELYLVELDDELLVVRKKITYGNDDITFMIHRLDAKEKKLVRVHDLGDRSLFLQRGGSISSSLPDHLMSNNNFFTKNCIYFFKHVCELFQELYYIGRFQVGKSLPCSFSQEYICSRKAVWVPSPVV